MSTKMSPTGHGLVAGFLSTKSNENEPSLLRICFLRTLQLPMASWISTLCVCVCVCVCVETIFLVGPTCSKESRAGLASFSHWSRRRSHRISRLVMLQARRPRITVRWNRRSRRRPTMSSSASFRRPWAATPAAAAVAAAAAAAAVVVTTAAATTTAAAAAATTSTTAVGAMATPRQPAPNGRHRSSTRS